ncbi:hypothetical protein PF327_04835 [Sulfurovum sp. XTW-4]|uniref:Uncharacterized protein n=1 Tax=Sulfurovum xiamenensis TaxID=3019066 RepID=A0ABT7QR53_9BACT|nr:hypothetical protein [Sulfurovum xiamenensis]MDM5263516.1 hypothetical protein [Sulfurovum xiamenensis]
MDIFVVSFFVVISFFIAKFFSKEKNSLSIKDQRNTKVITNKHGNVFYQINEENIYSGKVKSIIIALESPTEANFTIRKKTWIESVLVKLHILNIFKTKNSKLDENIICMSDEELLQERLLNPALQNALLSLFEQKFQYAVKNIEISNEEKMFFIKFNLKLKFKRKALDMGYFLDIFNQNIYRIIELLDLKPITNKTEIKLYEKLISIKFLLFFIALMSFFLTITESHKIYPSVIDSSKYILYSSIASLVFASCIFYRIFKITKNSSKRLQISLRYFIFSIISSILLLGLIIKYSNTILDKSQPNMVVYKVSGKFVRARYRCYFDVANENAKIDVRVPRILYNQKQKGDYVKLHIKNGFLGISWVSNVE